MKKGIARFLPLVFIVVSSLHSAENEAYAILPFESIGFSDQSIANVVAEFVQYSFVKNYPNLVCIERARINKLMQEQSFQSTGASEQAVEVGKLLGATSVIYGTISKLGNKITLFVNVSEVQTGKILYSKSDSKVTEIENIDKELIFPLIKTLFTTEEIKKSGQTIIIKQCLNLVGIRRNRYPNAFVEILSAEKSIGQTSTVANNASPVFNQRFEIHCSEPRTLLLRIYDSGPNFRDLIGGVIVSLPECESNKASHEDSSSTQKLATSITNLALTLSNSRPTSSSANAQFPLVISNGQYQLIRQEGGAIYRTGMIILDIE